MNSKVVVGIAIAIAIIAVFALSQEQSNESNQVSNEPEKESSVEISDSATITKNNQNFEINEDGTKKYIISARDAPVIEN